MFLHVTGNQKAGAKYLLAQEMSNITTKSMKQLKITTYVQKQWSVSYGNQISLNVDPVFD